jgi:hypothetical protein
LGDRVGRWTVVSTLRGGVAVEEDLTRMDGPIRVGDVVLARTAEPTAADPGSLYCGHTLAGVLGSDTDIIGAALLAGGDPDPAAVTAALAPIVRMDVHTWVGTGAAAMPFLPVRHEGKAHGKGVGAGRPSTGGCGAPGPGRPMPWRRRDQPRPGCLSRST